MVNTSVPDILEPQKYLRSQFWVKLDTHFPKASDSTKCWAEQSYNTQ